LADIALELVDLWFWYHEEDPVLRGVNLSIPCGQFVALVGANGSGKTTLIKHYNGLLRACRGTVRVGGQDAAKRSIGELARQVGYLFQHPEQQIFSPTVREELAFGPRNLGLDKAAVEVRVQTVLRSFELTAVAEQPPAILSYGLRRRVTLASLAAMDPPILVLDEPSVGLDAPGLQETMRWLLDCQARGRTIVLVSHDMALVAEYAERAIVLDNGQVRCDAAPAELFRQTELLGEVSLAPPPVFALSRALLAAGMNGSSLTVSAFCAEYATLAETRRLSRPAYHAPHEDL
jgi:energy-coupling factor transport system ATP-binding protein